MEKIEKLLRNKTKNALGLKELVSFLILFTLLFSSALISVPETKAVFCGDCGENKIDICHRTGSAANPYNLISVDKNATAGGHDGHEGGIYPADPWGDIIPPYDYQEWEVVGSHQECPKGYSPSETTCPGKCYKITNPFNPSKCKDMITVDDYDWVTHQYPGKNWTTEGEAIWNNQCVVPPVCGNGVQEGDEECDDGNVVSGDGCSSECQEESLVTCAVEENGVTCDNYLYENYCEFVPDDGAYANTRTCNASSGYSCSSLVNITRTFCPCGCSNGACVESCCGDGIINGGEECDGDDLGDYTCETVNGFTGGTLGCNPDCTFKTDQCTSDEPLLTVIAHKVVCENESDDLPDWGNGGPDITASTAADYVAQHPNCHLESGWDFQWQFGSSNSPGNPGDNIGDAGGSWTTFGPTDSNGLATTDIYSLSDYVCDDRIWVREITQEGYIPFSGDNTIPRDDNTSAEFYCHTDVLNYDNYDFILHPQLGNTYYCIAFNVPIEEPTYQCSDDIDNDQDGFIDYPDDPGCTGPEDDDEYNEPEPVCGNGVKEGEEQCDGTDGVTPGENFCTINCELVPIYDGLHSCPEGTLRSENPVWSGTISGEDADGEFINGLSGQLLFEASGTFVPTSAANWHADAGYSTDNNWSSVKSDYGIQGTGENYAAHALLSDVGTGEVGVVDWGTYNPDHVYTKYYDVASDNGVQFVIGDRYSNWFGTKWDNQTGMNDNEGSLNLNIYACNAVSICGNGDVEPGEDCDDGNLVNWDGCSDECKIDCNPNEELVTNGGFENPVVEHSAKWNIFNAVPGWMIEWMPGSGDSYDPMLELHRGVNGWLPQEGDQYAELDTDWDGPDADDSIPNEAASTKIYQDLDTVPGWLYSVSFYFSPRPDTDEANNQLDFSWDGDPKDTISAAGNGQTDWDSYSYQFGASGDTTRLQFADSGNSDSLGTFLDNVSVRCQIPEEPVYGCTDPEASNYNPDATVDDDSCEYPPEEIPGCTDPEASNYNPDATVDDDSCEYEEETKKTTRVGGGPVVPPDEPEEEPTYISFGESEQEGEVLGEEVVVEEPCGIYLYEYIKCGADNNPEEVKKLQTFLNEHLHINLAVTGIYDQATMQAVNEFQVQYKEQVLHPWYEAGVHCSPDEPTGYVYKTTKRWINLIVCPTLDLPMPDLSGYPKADCTAVLGEATTTGDDVSGEMPLGEETLLEEPPSEEVVGEELDLASEDETATGTAEERPEKMSWLWLIIILLIIIVVLFVIYKATRKGKK